LFLEKQIFFFTLRNEKKGIASTRGNRTQAINNAQLISNILVIKFIKD
jgi:hypothetical protein